MKRHKILKSVLVFLAVLLTYELTGFFVSYTRQPDVSEETKHRTAAVIADFAPSEIPERAAIIEDNSDGLLQRVRLIENARENVTLSTFSFHSDESGKIMIGSPSGCC